MEPQRTTNSQTILRKNKAEASHFLTKKICHKATVTKVV